MSRIESEPGIDNFLKDPEGFVKNLHDLLTNDGNIHAPWEAEEVDGALRVLGKYVDRYKEKLQAAAALREEDRERHSDLLSGIQRFLAGHHFQGIKGLCDALRPFAAEYGLDFGPDDQTAAEWTQPFMEFEPMTGGQLDGIGFKVTDVGFDIEGDEEGELTLHMYKMDREGNWVRHSNAQQK